MNTGRRLSEEFMSMLQCDVEPGINRFLSAVKRDRTLCLEIRHNYINIYYRGGNLIKLGKEKGKFCASFDRKYLIFNQTGLPEWIGKQEISKTSDVADRIDAIPCMKQAMDWYFSRYPKNERELQQVMVRENNFCSAAKGTDYFICDIEYSTENRRRFDLIAAHWPSASSQRKINDGIGLAFIEMKYMNKSMARNAGIAAHVRDMAEYYRRNQDNFTSLKCEMKTVFNQKRELGLIDNQKPINSFNEKKPNFILVFANHDPASSILIKEFNKIEDLPHPLPFELKFAVSNFMGSGLYDQNIYDYDTFRKKFACQIYSKEKPSE